VSGISERTIRRWLDSDPTFPQLVSSIRARALERAAGMLARGSAQAVRTLRDLMDPSKPDTVRLSAARAWLDSVLRVRELVEIEARLVALEERARMQREKVA
jgi:hypothetical protein